MKTILLVDDDASLRRLVQVTLGSDRYRILHAADGRAALAVASRQRVDLALVDVDMPGPDGYAVCRVLKALPLDTRPRVAMLTSLRGPADRANGELAGADEYLGKPFSPARLLDTVVRLLAADRPCPARVRPERTWSTRGSS